MKLITRTLLALALGVATSVQASGERKVDETRPLRADGEVRVSNVAGDIKVVAWNRNEVKVTGTLGEDVERFEFTGGDAAVEIRVILPRRGCHNCDGSAELVINVPTKARLEVDTVSADITAQGTDGVQRLNSVSGDVEVRSKSGDLTLKSVSGDVTVEGSAARARVEAKTVSGSVVVRGVEGEIRGGSVSGGVEVRDSRAERLELQSTSGSVEYRGPLLGSGTYDFQSVSGSVELELVGTRDAAYDVSTFSGDIDNAFGPKPRRTSEYGPGRELRFTEGKGAARVRINTLSGEVVIR
jgi:DUF4097 and DUF4098 domain-containing protein YvlB